MLQIWKLADELPMLLISSFLTVTFVKHIAGEFKLPYAKKWIGIIFTLYLFITIFIDVGMFDPTEYAFRVLFLFPFAMILFSNLYIFHYLTAHFPEPEKDDQLLYVAKHVYFVRCLPQSAG
jgi:hypothetical protein